MSERMSVYLLPLAAGVAHPRTPAAALTLVAGAASAENSGLRKATSTASWHSTLASKLARGCSIEGLGFLSNDLRVLAPAEAEAAANAVDQLLQRLEDGDISETRESLGRQWDLIISQADVAEEMAAVVPCVDVDEENGETQSFLEFLVALQIAAHDASERNTHLLFFSRSEA